LSKFKGGGNAGATPYSDGVMSQRDFGGSLYDSQEEDEDNDDDDLYGKEFAEEDDVDEMPEGAQAAGLQTLMPHV
jgi:hypothetical protein